MPSTKELRTLCGNFPAATGIVCDNFAFTELAELPDFALDDFNSLLLWAKWSGSMPLQTLLSVLSLLAKKQGGYRTIAVIASWARALLKTLAPDLGLWDNKAAIEGDTAQRGVTAELEIAKRALNAEIAVLQGRADIAVLWALPPTA